jgi:hypothetical protein
MQMSPPILGHRPTGRGKQAAVDLDGVVDELYGVDPAAFTARRDALVAEARKEGDRDRAAAIKALRRPSAAAHAVNLVARRRDDQIDRLVELGQRLRQAQEARSGDELRALGRQRQQVVAGLAHEARVESAAAGLNLSDAARREVEWTFEAALGDEAAAAAIRSRRLVRSLVRTGLDPVDLQGAVAGGGGAAAPRQANRRDRDRSAGATRAPADQEAAPQTDEKDAPARAESELARAESELARAESELARAEEAAARTAAAADQAERELARVAADDEAATRRRAEADEEVSRLQERLAAARNEADLAADAERACRRARREAEVASEMARREADAAATAREQARDRLSRLRPPP